MKGLHRRYVVVMTVISSELQKIKYIKRTRSIIIHADGKTFGIDIAKLFPGKYHELYASVAFNVNDFECLQNYVRELIWKSCSAGSVVFTVNDVLIATSKL